jgi:Tol biopolymer transport system component
MRGDIWKVPAEGGEAIALTRGPAYHFEPAWSPDGRRLVRGHSDFADPIGQRVVGDEPQ